MGTAVACWLLAAALLTGVVVAASRTPDELPGAPALGGPTFVVALVLLAAQAALLTWSPARPATILVAVSAAAPVGALLGMGPAVGSTTVVVLVATFAAVSRRRTTPARTWTAVGVAALLVAGGDLLAQLDAGEPYASAAATALVQGVGTLGLAALVALVVSSRREARSATVDRTRAVESEQVALVEAAVSRERTAMARELHDIAAHHLSGIAVMSAAIGRQIDTDPEGAKRAVAQVREQSRAMLDDMRGLVGLLRPTETDHEVGGASAAADYGVVREESLVGIASLVAAAGRPRRARGPRRHRTDGRGPASRDRTAGPAVGLPHRAGGAHQCCAPRSGPAVPRRAGREPAGPRHDHGRPTTSVLSHLGRAAGGGFGLVGMRERAELTDSRLACGPVGDTWVVTVEIPVRDRPRPTSEESP